MLGIPGGDCFKDTLLGTNISPQKGTFESMMFLFPRWDMLVPWRVLSFWRTFWSDFFEKNWIFDIFVRESGWSFWQNFSEVFVGKIYETAECFFYIFAVDSKVFQLCWWLRSAVIHPWKLTCHQKVTILLGNTSSNHWFSEDMLVFRGVNVQIHMWFLSEHCWIPSTASYLWFLSLSMKLWLAPPVSPGFPPGSPSWWMQRYLS